MRYETPTIIDLGSIADHTFTRCGGTHAPKDPDCRFAKDNFGEASSGHGIIS